MTDTELADLLRSRRTMTQEQVDRVERARDIEQGEFVSRELSVHHFEESRH